MRRARRAVIATRVVRAGSGRRCRDRVSGITQQTESRPHRDRSPNKDGWPAATMEGNRISDLSRTVPEGGYTASTELVPDRSHPQPRLRGAVLINISRTISTVWIIEAYAAAKARLFGGSRPHAAVSPATTNRPGDRGRGARPQISSIGDVRQSRWPGGRAAQPERRRRVAVASAGHGDEIVEAALQTYRALRQDRDGSGRRGGFVNAEGDQSGSAARRGKLSAVHGSSAAWPRATISTRRNISTMSARLPIEGRAMFADARSKVL